MKTLEIILISLICIIILGLQHLFNYLIRKNFYELGIFGIIISAIVLGIAIYNFIQIFGQ